MDTLEKLKNLRKTNHFTQEQVAKLIGTSGPNYSLYESGKQKLTIDHIKKLSKIYNVSVDYLLNDSYEITITKEQLEILIKAKNVIQELEKIYEK